MMQPIDGSIRFRVLVDRSSVEVFGNGGRVVVTDRIFPNGASDSVTIFAEGGSVMLRSLDAYQLKKAAFV